MTTAVQTLIRSADAAVARLYLAMFQERNALVPFLFHSIFHDEDEIDLDIIDPLQRTTVAKFRQLIDYYSAHGYRFISPADLLGGLKADRKYAMITFDDGYYNNSLVLPVLEKYGVPAIFFISTSNVQQNKAYWWDVLHRHMARDGAPARKIWQEAAALKYLKTDQIEAELVRRFGADAFQPLGDIDRPFTPAELKAFAAHPLVHIGNHTANHAILTNYGDDEIRQQIHSSQDALETMTGKRPIAIAYPNGAFNDRIGDLCSEIGLQVGFTVRPAKRLLPLDPHSPGMLRLGRFTPHGEAPIVTQCRTYRSDVLFYGLFRDTYLRLRRWHVAY